MRRNGPDRTAASARSWSAWTVAAAFALVLAAGLAACEVRPLDPETGRAIVEDEAAKFDADSFVEQNWSDRILPALRSDPAPIDSVLAGIQAMDDERLGELASEARVVSGRGRVTELDDASRARLFRIDAPPYDGEVDYSLQVGPVIRGTAIRDAVPFISFDQFVNQLEYAGVARSLNERLVDTVLNDLDFESLVGSDIVFTGVLPLRNPDARMVTPVEIRRQSGSDGA